MEKLNTNFHDNEIPKQSSQFIYLLVILVESVFRTCKNYYLKVFLEKCKFVVKEQKMPEYITDDVENSSGDCEDFHEKIPNEENYDEVHFVEANSIQNCRRLF